MTFSMATDGYPAMHQSWGHWPSLYMQGPYMTPHWQGNVPASGSCMYGVPEYRAEKPPLTQLQELTSVFPAPDEHPSQHNRPPSHCEPVLRRDAPPFLSEAHFRAKERFGDRECDSGYTPDMSRTEKMCEREPDAGYSSDRPSLEQECDGGFATEPPGPRECDSGFGPAFTGKEEPDTYSEMCGECDSGCTRDLPIAALDCAVGPRDALADSDSGCADLTGKWEEETPCPLPGFHQAFGSTEIGRFSRNDFFTNPSPPQTVEPVSEPPRKAVRKPRSPRVKQVRKERAESPKPRPELRAESASSVPMPEGAPCNSRMCGAPYESCAPRYCSEYTPPPPPTPSNYPYARNSAPYPSYPHCELPYFRPFPFPLPCAQTWSEPRWPTYQPSYQQSYQQPYQPQQPWTSANVYPFMRLDY